MIKAREMEMRNEVLSNPMTLKKIQKEIQMLKEGKSAKHERKNHSKHHKKHKKHRRSRSRSDSSRSHSSSRERKSDRRPKHNSEYERLKAEIAALKNGPVKKQENASELGPNLALYSERQRQLEEQDRLKKAQTQPTKQLT